MNYVYEITNTDNQVIYVGETKDPDRRRSEHRRNRFKGIEIELTVVKEFNTKREAFNYQCELQKQYGLVTDLELCTAGGKANKGVKKKCTKKMSEARTGVPMAETARRKLCATTKEQDRIIIIDRQNGMSMQKIADKHGVSRGIIRRVLR
jgi:hypothetical protein